MADLAKIFSYIDEHEKKFIDNLSKAVAIPSVSASPECRPKVKEMVEWAGRELESFGAKVEIIDLGNQTLPSGLTLPLPPVLLGILGEDPKKKTLCIYGHLDVQPAQIEDGWDSEPFVLTERNGKLYGRGSTDDKGPVLGWFHAIEAFRETGQELPLNLRFVLEGMEESGSVGLDELLLKRKEFFGPVDFVCISDSYWLGTKKPCLTYGLRGVCYFYIEIECARKDLHSGVYGGSMYEGMSDLIYMMNSLVDVEGKLLITGIYDDVAPLTDEERELYKDIEFDVAEFRSDIGGKRLRHKEDKGEILMHRWRNPSLSIHGIEGAFSESGEKTVIPRKIIGKFSIRIVPNHTVEGVERCVVKYLNDVWAKRGSPNQMKAYLSHGGIHWLSNPRDANFQAGVRATEKVYKQKPDFIREGGSIPVTLTLQDVSGKSVLLLPMGAADDGAHSQNEKIDIRNYIEGVSYNFVNIFLLFVC
ncbi:unnamed protein product [Notodromas monacha]|uniref:Peptidase M20 dimerisation domain-containing protein n=1 Tax=Notodromas monacha TaxID=399045 RepID=A0A7R9BFZ8_9CRUS|nr:unnamed protein product [Notodromas monacha]CAG0913409.1 unnamed protein product [Notodromas monacha]